MADRSDIAIQFITQKEANRFIKTYEKELVAICKIEHDGGRELSYFSEYDEPYITNEFGEVIYFWGSVKFYSDYPAVAAMINTLETNNFSCKFISLSYYGDIERNFGKEPILKPIYTTSHDGFVSISYSEKKPPLGQED